MDENGRVTTDPKPLVLEPSNRNSEILGALLPLGPRGVGWLIWVEVLSGLLSGVAVSKDITWHASAEHPWEAGVFLMAIIIDRLVPIDQFKARVDDFNKGHQVISTSRRLRRNRLAGRTRPA